MTKICSFDVFDSVLLRRTAFPSDVFRLTATRIADEFGVNAKREFVEDFVCARIQAERIALYNCEETTLERIWVVLRRLLPDIPVDCTAKRELAAEQHVLTRNSIVSNTIEKLRSSGHRIVFVSDSYPPQS